MTSFYRTGLLLTLLFLVTPIAALSSRSALAAEAAVEAGPRPALSVIVAPVEQQTIHSSVTATGTVAAWREMPIGAEISGYAVIAVDVDEGDRVSAGQRLAKLNDAVIKAQIGQQQAAIAEAEASLAKARSDLGRANRMTKGVLSEQTVEERATAVKTAEARLAAAEALLAQFQAQLDQTEILAPADGIVAKRSVTLGQVISSGNELFRMIRDGRLEVAAAVPEADLLRTRPGQPAAIAGPSGQRYSGEVRLVGEMVDPQTRLGTVYVALQPDTPLKIGMFARVEIDTESNVAMAVPQKALVWRDGKAGLFVLESDDTVRFAPVSLGRQSGAYVEVADGLSLGQRIVVTGAGLLNEGDRVRAEIASAALPDSGAAVDRQELPREAAR